MLPNLLVNQLIWQILLLDLSVALKHKLVDLCCTGQLSHLPGQTFRNSFYIFFGVDCDASGGFNIFLDVADVCHHRVRTHQDFFLHFVLDSSTNPIGSGFSVASLGEAIV